MKTSVALLASGAPWEAAVLAGAPGAGVAVLKRCVDLTDLMATAAMGQVTVAVISTEVPRLDAEAVLRLRQYDVDVVAVGPPAEADRIARLGASCLAAAEVSEIFAAVATVVSGRTAPLLVGHETPPVQRSAERGRIIAVWGPAGAPGRTTVSLGLAAETAAAGRRVELIDADPYGGCVAARLGVLDESSGLLAVARSANAGLLDEVGFTAATRRISTHLDLLTGLPRPDRRIEVRPEILTRVLDVAAQIGDVVVDTGFCLEDGDRDRMTIEALAAADQIVVVGAADPVGLARLARALTDLDEQLGGAGTAVRVVINRFRPTHGWSLAEVLDFLKDYPVPLTVRSIPEDQMTLDRSLVGGRTLVELGVSTVRSAVAVVAADCFPDAFTEVRPKRRKAGTTRRW